MKVTHSLIIHAKQNCSLHSNLLCCFTGCKDLMQLEWENTIGNMVPLAVFAKHSLLQK